MQTAAAVVLMVMAAVMVVVGMVGPKRTARDETPSIILICAGLICAGIGIVLLDASEESAGNACEATGGEWRKGAGMVFECVTP